MKIVFYGDNNNWFAAYAYWVARMYGHTDVALMNGGRKKWEAEGRDADHRRRLGQDARGTRRRIWT